MPTALVNAIELFYERGGEGPRLLFLNGSGATIATTELLINLFTGDFDTLVHDQRGLGATAVPPGPYEMADYAADALALLDHVGWERARVVGISFGGMVAQELAVTAPERVERLALLCTSPGGAGGASYPLHELASMPERDARAKGTQLLDTRFTPEWLAIPSATVCSPRGWPPGGRARSPASSNEAKRNNSPRAVATTSATGWGG